MSEEDEEDYGALIYRESQLRKAEAAAAAAVARDAKKKNDTGNGCLPVCTDSVQLCYVMLSTIHS